jgi:hypothetical protein
MKKKESAHNQDIQHASVTLDKRDNCAKYARISEKETQTTAGTTRGTTQGCGSSTRGSRAQSEARTKIKGTRKARIHIEGEAEKAAGMGMKGGNYLSRHC